MITPVNPRVHTGPRPKEYNKSLSCDYHLGEVGHVVENCRVLSHCIQDLIDQGMLKLEMEKNVNAVETEGSDEIDLTTMSISWRPLFHALREQGYLTLMEALEGPLEGDVCEYHSGAQGHSLECYEEFKKEVNSLVARGLIRKRGEQPKEDCMMINKLRFSPHEKMNFQARMDRIKEDFEEFCEKRKERKDKYQLEKSATTAPPGTSKSNPVIIRYSAKEKAELQTIMIYVTRPQEKILSVIIQLPQSFQYKDNNKVPWNYRMQFITTWENKPKIEEGEVGNLTLGFMGIIRSGKCYTLKELEKRRKEMGKTTEDPTRTKAAEEEAVNFLRIIKSSEYNVMKQLSKMPWCRSIISSTLKYGVRGCRSLRSCVFKR
uniref:Uncharacterized protein n=1 Tax=Fagus sylvatica TaxID=28930 RepID=A0A2N9HXE1_FAGSY